MQKSQDPADFTTILGAAVHDMKNSLWLLLQNIENVANELEGSPAGRSLADIQYEAQRLNTGLMQLLSLYRNEQAALPINTEEQFLDELLEELQENNRFYADRHEITLTVAASDNLAWYMDRTLITVLLQDVVINALRYAKSQVAMKAERCDNKLRIEIRDDGPGYPHDMLQDAAEMRVADIESGRTGLGLYFASRIAQAHTRSGQHGTIRLQNSDAGGSIFELWLP
ncbi:sensor histidine kinase [Aliidiomarina sp. Khilg15.8]